MKMKKIIALSLAFAMLAGMSAFADASARPEIEVQPLQTFDSGTEDWALSTSNDATIANSDGSLYVTDKSGSEAGVQLAFDGSVSSDKAFALEYSIKVPALKADGTANSTGKVRTSLWDSFADGYKNRTHFLVFDTTDNQIENNGDKKLCSFEFGKWYNVKIEVDISSKKYRATVSDESGSRLAWGTNSYTSAFASVGAMRFYADTAAVEFYVDNLRAHSFAHDDINAGWVFFDDEMNYENAADAVIPTTDHYVFNIRNSETGSAIICQADEGSEDKYMRIKTSGGDDNAIQFKRSVPSTAISGFDSSTTSSSKALIYGARLRIADTSKKNDIKLLLTQGSDTNTRLLTVYAYKNQLSLGTGDNEKFFDNVVLDSNVWYDVKLYHNTVSGYMRAELTDTSSGKTEIFEHSFLREGYDLGNYGHYGFLNTCEEAACVDYDKLSLTVAAQVYTQKLCGFGEVSLSSSELAAGDISASVDVTEVYSQAENIVTDVAKLVVAYYCAENELCGVDVVGVKPVTGTYTAKVTLPSECGGGKVKAMLWSSEYTPLQTPLTLGE